MSLGFVLSSCTAVHFHSVVCDGICSSRGKFVLMNFDSDCVSQSCNALAVLLKCLVISVNCFSETDDMGRFMGFLKWLLEMKKMWA